jgi:hypothetical protein
VDVAVDVIVVAVVAVVVVVAAVCVLSGRGRRGSDDELVLTC